MRMLGIRPGVFWALFVASVRMFVRNRAAVFFSLFLPLIIMLIFGVLNFEGTTTIQLGIVDEAENAASARLGTRLEAYDYIALSSGSPAAGRRGAPPAAARPAPGGGAPAPPRRSASRRSSRATWGTSTSW